MVAIAITLLAIDLPVPIGSTVSLLWTAVQHDDGHSRVPDELRGYRGGVERSLRLFRQAKGTDARMRVLDCGWLLTIVLNPFATKLLVVSDQTVATHALRFGFYALLQVLQRRCCT